MSGIYIQEPPTNGKVLLGTTVGDIDIELWSKEAPKACRNFVQLCLEGYYNGTIFHRIVKGFICQGGDPTGTGMGGESIYGKPFKDEFHQRLRFIRRGLVAMANAGPNDNQSQFFFTLGRADELNKKHTIFGKVSGNTIYNMIRVEDVEVDENDRPFDPPKILKTEVLSNPFDDIEPRKTQKIGEEEKKERSKSKSKATKNYKLLSFGDEAEEDEEEADVASESLKIKSTHDVLDDPKLSSHTAADEIQKKTEIKTEKELSKSAMVRNKLKKEKDRKRPVTEGSDEEQERNTTKPKARKTENETDTTVAVSHKNKKEENDMLQGLLSEKKEFVKKMKKDKLLRKGEGRESATLSLLAGFQDRLSGIQEDISDDPGAAWMNHKLQFEDDIRQAKDANIRDEDSFDIYDPRNPLNKRRRETKKPHKYKKVS